MIHMRLPLLALAGAPLAQAHHGWSAYDSQQVPTLETATRTPN